MCGICGFVGRADERLVRAMTDALAHRGPDGEGICLFPSVDGGVPVSLGHRRLSILDTGPRSAQPMSTAKRRYWITYNGEVYNFRELRSLLEREGARFTTECDTEVVLAMYERYGPAMLARLNGIFALAIWDRDRSELFLARDRLGVKPVYYALHRGILYFAYGGRASSQHHQPSQGRLRSSAEVLVDRRPRADASPPASGRGSRSHAVRGPRSR